MENISVQIRFRPNITSEETQSTLQIEHQTNSIINLKTKEKLTFGMPF